VVEEGLVVEEVKVPEGEEGIHVEPLGEEGEEPA